MKHRYSDELCVPPALVVEVTLIVPGTGRRAKYRGKIDTAADLSVIPGDFAIQHRLPRFAERRGHGFGGRPPVAAPTYLVDLKLDGYDFSMEVVGHAGGYVLIGRDILNELVLIANGPREEFELLRPGQQG